MDLCGAAMSAGRTCGKRAQHRGSHLSVEALERIRAKRATPEYRARQAELARRHYDANVDRIKARNAADYQANFEKRQAQQREWRESHPGYHAEHTRLWADNNPEKVAANRAKQGAKAKARRVANRGNLLRRRALAKLHKAACGTTGNRVWIQGPCWVCGTDFLSQWRDVKYCGKTCAKREAKDRRRALEAGVKITPGRRYGVYIRDNWICQLCRLPIERNAKVPDDYAATIDHVIPLRHRGAHAPDNWQTAHFICNSRKGDRLAA